MESEDKPWHTIAPGTKNEKGGEADELDITKLEGCFASITPTKTLTRMHVIMADGSVQTLQFHHVDVKGTFKGNEFEFIFAGTKFWSLRVKGFGPKLWRVYDLISLHRMPYIRQATEKEAKFAKDGETLLTKIEIVDVTPRDE